MKKNISSSESNRQISNNLIGGFTVVFLGRILDVALSFINNVLLVLLMSIEEVGAYFLCFSLIAMLATIARLGLGKTCVRLVAEYKEKKDNDFLIATIFNVLILGLLSSVGVAIILNFDFSTSLVYSLFESDLLIISINLASIWLVFFSMQNILSEVFRGFGDIKFATLFGGLLTRVVLFSAFLFLYTTDQGGLQLVVFSSVSAYAINVLISSLFILRLFKQNFTSINNKHKSNFLRKKVIFSSFNEISKISWPLWFSATFSFFLIQSSVWIVGAFESEQTVAIYGVAERLITLVAIPMFVVNAVIPKFIVSMTLTGQTYKLDKILRIISSLAIIPCLLLSTLFFFYGEIFIKSVFGAEYLESLPVLFALFLGRFFYMLVGPCENVLNMTGNQLSVMLVTLFSGGLAVILSLLLVSEYSALGVAFAFSVAMVVERIILLILVNKYCGVSTHVSLKYLREGLMLMLSFIGNRKNEHNNLS